MSRCFACSNSLPFLPAPSPISPCLLFEAPVIPPCLARCFISRAAPLPTLLWLTTLHSPYRCQVKFNSPGSPLEPQPEPTVPPTHSQMHPAEKAKGALTTAWLAPWQTSLMDHDTFEDFPRLSGKCLPRVHNVGD